MLNKLRSLALALLWLSSSHFALAQEIAPMNPKSDFTKLKSILGKDKTVTITYPHPREPSKFGDVFFKLNFDDATVEMGNKLGSYKGYFFAIDNLLCAASKEFSTNCFVISKTNNALSMALYSNQSVDLKAKIE